MKRKKFIRISALGIAAAAAPVKNLIAASAGRSVDKVVTSIRSQVSDELWVRRSLPAPGLSYIDPFVMLDHFGPLYMEPGEGAFVPPHPHRGFEPVTFLFEGQAEHKDSKGNHAVLNSGDVQWMTSGSGIVHQEDMGKNFVSEVRRVNGVQLWVNLPARHKFTEARYQNIPKSKIPSFSEDHGRVSVSVVAGNLFGTQGAASTFTPVIALMIDIKPGGRLEVPVPASYNSFVHVLDGAIILPDGKQAVEGQLVLYRNDGSHIEIKSDPAPGKKTSLLLLAGEPLNEPVVSYGPFVMNTRAEINQAYMDYRNGKMGTIDH